MQRQVSTVSAATLKQIDSYQYPSAHVGHLSEQQISTLEQFKSLCKEAGFYNPGNKSGEKPSHDDETLLRYLRARKFVPPEALQQFKETEEWRKKNKIDELYETIDIVDFDETRKLYPQWIGRRDKRGIPVYVFEVAELTSKRLAAYEKNTKSVSSSANISAKLYRLFALYENLVRFVLPLCSHVPDRAYPETPVSQSNNIVDISKVGLKQFWNLKGHMQDASQLATAHYPETLDRIFIIGAPSFFPTVWGWIKRWFDPITVSKIFILSHSNVQKTLEEYIDPENIPKKYGGTLEWEWGQMPNVDPAIYSALNWHKGETGPGGKETFPRGPIRWKENKDGDLAAIAVGSVDGKQRMDEVATLKGGHDSLAVDSLAVDATDTLYGPPSTTGIHTHPSHEQEYFPTSGQTPTEEDEPEPNMTAEGEANAGQGFPTPFMTPFEQPKQPGEVPREGTSLTRKEQQNDTHAQGQLHSGTPATVERETGDKTVTMEPSTIGQAQKVVDTPEAEQQKGGPTYLEQAKAAASSALANGTEAVSHAMAAVGLNGNKEKEAESEGVVIEKTPEDPRVDQMKTDKVEDFIRDKYANHEAGTVPSKQ